MRAIPCCISWGHGEKCTTCSMIMAVKHSYSISCWDESHCFVIDDVDTSCLGHVMRLKKVIWTRLFSNGARSPEATNIWTWATEKIFLVARLGDLLVFFSWFTVKKQKENVVQLGARWYSKVVPREFTCNIIINFDRDIAAQFSIWTAFPN